MRKTPPPEPSKSHHQPSGGAVVTRRAIALVCTILSPHTHRVAKPKIGRRLLGDACVHCRKHCFVWTSVEYTVEREQGKVCLLARWSVVGTCSSSSEAKPHVSSNGPRPAKLLAKVLKQSDAISPTKDPSTSKPHGVALESFIVSDSDDRRRWRFPQSKRANAFCKSTWNSVCGIWRR